MVKTRHIPPEKPGEGGGIVRSACEQDDDDQNPEDPMPTEEYMAWHWMMYRDITGQTVH